MATDEPANSPDLGDVHELVSRQVRDHLFFLRDEFGYEGPTLSSIGGADARPTLKAEYANVRAGRRVSLSLEVDSDGDHAGVAIWRLPVRTYRKDLINLHVLIWSRLPDFDQSRLDFQNYKGTLNDRLAEYLKVNARLLREEAADILRGENWEEGLYDY